MFDNETIGSQETVGRIPHSNSIRACYEIRVRDHLDPCWWRWFEGWTLTNLEDGEVLLVCEDIDQSALHGALNKIRDLNLLLLSVTRMQK